MFPEITTDESLKIQCLQIANTIPTETVEQLIKNAEKLFNFIKNKV